MVKIKILQKTERLVDLLNIDINQLRDNPNSHLHILVKKYRHLYNHLTEKKLIKETYLINLHNLLKYFSNDVIVLISFKKQVGEKYIFPSKTKCVDIKGNIVILSKGDIANIVEITPSKRMLCYLDKSMTKITEKNIKVFLKSCIENFICKNIKPIVIDNTITYQQDKHEKIKVENGIKLQPFLVKLIKEYFGLTFDKTYNSTFISSIPYVLNVDYSIFSMDELEVKELFDEIVDKRTLLNTFKQNIDLKLDSYIELQQFLEIIKSKMDTKVWNKVKDAKTKKEIIKLLSSSQLRLLKILHAKTISDRFNIISNSCPHVKLYNKIRKNLEIDEIKSIYEKLHGYSKKSNNKWIDCKRCNYPIMCSHMGTILQSIIDNDKLDEIIVKLKKYTMSENQNEFICKYCGEELYSYYTDTVGEYNRDSILLYNEDIRYEIVKILRSIIRINTFFIPISRAKDLEYFVTKTIYKFIDHKEYNSVDQKTTTIIYCYAYCLFLTTFKIMSFNLETRNKNTVSTSIGLQTSIAISQMQSRLNISYEKLKKLIFNAFTNIKKNYIIPEVTISKLNYIKNTIYNDVVYKFIKNIIMHTTNIKNPNDKMILGYTITNIDSIHTNVYDSIYEIKNPKTEIEKLYMNVRKNIVTNIDRIVKDKIFQIKSGHKMKYGYDKTNQYLSKDIKLSFLFDENGEKHKWDLFDKKRDSLKCSVCKILKINTHLLSEKKIEKMLKIKVSLEEFYIMFNVKCPAKGVHNFVNNTCTKCKVKFSTLTNRSNKEYFNKYKQKLYLEKENLKKHLSPKKYKVTSRKLTKEKKWTPEMSNIFYVSNLTKINKNRIFMLGLLENNSISNYKEPNRSNTDNIISYITTIIIYYYRFINITEREDFPFMYDILKKNKISMYDWKNKNDNKLELHLFKIVDELKKYTNLRTSDNNRFNIEYFCKIIKEISQSNKNITKEFGEWITKKIFKDEESLTDRIVVLEENPNELHKENAELNDIETNDKFISFGFSYEDLDYNGENE